MLVNRPHLSHWRVLICVDRHLKDFSSSRLKTALDVGHVNRQVVARNLAAARRSSGGDHTNSGQTVHELGDENGEFPQRSYWISSQHCHAQGEHFVRGPPFPTQLLAMSYTDLASTSIRMPLENCAPARRETAHHMWTEVEHALDTYHATLKPNTDTEKDFKRLIWKIDECRSEHFKEINKSEDLRNRLTESELFENVCDKRVKLHETFNALKKREDEIWLRRDVGSSTDATDREPTQLDPETLSSQVDDSAPVQK